MKDKKCQDCVFFARMDNFWADESDPDGQCEHGDHWRPKGGNFKIHHDDKACKLFISVKDEKEDLL